MIVFSGAGVVVFGDGYHMLWQLGLRPSHPNYLCVFCKLHGRVILLRTGASLPPRLSSKDAIFCIMVGSSALITGNRASWSLGAICIILALRGLLGLSIMSQGHLSWLGAHQRVNGSVLCIRA